MRTIDECPVTWHKGAAGNASDYTMFFINSVVSEQPIRQFN